MQGFDTLPHRFGFVTVMLQNCKGMANIIITVEQYVVWIITNAQVPI